MPLLDRHAAAFGEQIETLASINVGTLWDRMLGEFLGEYERLQRRGLSADQIDRELEAFLNSLSDKFEADLARKSSTVAYNQGRGASLLGVAEEGEAQFVVRSEALDENTCGPCQTLDSAVFEIGTPEFYRWMPPAGCEGDDRCRGFYVAVGGGL